MSNENLGRELETIAKQSWELFVKDPITHIVSFLILGALGTVTFGIVAPALAVGYIKMIKKQKAGESIAIGDIFDGFSQFGTSFVTGLIIAIGVGLGIALLVIPGIIVMVITFFAMHHIAYNRASVSESLSGSLAMVKKKPALVVLLFIALSILNSLGSVAAVGVLLTGPLAVLASTIAFELIQQEENPPLTE